MAGEHYLGFALVDGADVAYRGVITPIEALTEQTNVSLVMDYYGRVQAPRLVTRPVSFMSAGIASDGTVQPVDFSWVNTFGWTPYIADAYSPQPDGSFTYYWSGTTQLYGKYVPVAWDGKWLGWQNYDWTLYNFDGSVAHYYPDVPMYRYGVNNSALCGDLDSYYVNRALMQSMFFANPPYIEGPALPPVAPSPSIVSTGETRLNVTSTYGGFYYVYSMPPYNNRWGQVTFHDDDYDEDITVATDAPAMSKDSMRVYVLHWRDVTNTWPFITLPAFLTDAYTNVNSMVFVYRMVSAGAGAKWLLYNVGAQPADVFTGISLPSGGGSPRLHMVTSRTQMFAGAPSTWKSVLHWPSGNVEFTFFVKIPITYYNSAVRYTYSGDLGRSWSVGVDLAVKAADGTALASGLSGTETWALQFLGYYTGSKLTLTYQGVIRANHCPSTLVDGLPNPASVPWPYKFPRASTLQFGADGSVYVNGVCGDYIDTSGVGTTPVPSGTLAAFVAACRWKAGKLTLDTTGRSGWRDASTLNADANISPYYPIWQTRGGSHGNRGAGGANTGPSRLLARGTDGHLYSSDDCGDTWQELAASGGQPNQSTLWMTQGASSDGTNSDASDFRSSSYTPLQLTATAHPLNVLVNTVTTGDGGSYQQIVITPALPPGKLVPRLEETVYGRLFGDGWNTGQATLAIVHLSANNVGAGELLVVSTNAGTSWKTVATSDDGGKTWYRGYWVSITGDVNGFNIVP